MPNRDEAWDLLTQYTTNDALLKHALAVEAAMRHYARVFGEDETLWGVVGLLHDFDYEKHPTPEEHPSKGAEILRSLDYDEALVKAVLSHARHTSVPRDTKLERTLFAVDELCGLITAVALVRPSKRLEDVRVKSVKKKLKDRAFARAVNREDILEGPEALGIDLDAHIDHVITAMRGISEELGL
ncbi:MAG: HDIG domain-containing protein [Candidatus Latescibacterota bacterium]|nr:MAG: HDIG domain-containing protein [Candidatus Latescibacterota bacterium]